MWHSPKNLKLISLGLSTFITVTIFYAVFREDRVGIAKIYFMDVGQGDAILIESSNGNKMMIDGGPQNNVLTALNRILPFYDKNIDVVMATHPDADHIGGIPAVLNRYNVSYMLETGNEAPTEAYKSMEQAIVNNDVSKIQAKAGMIVDFGDGSYLRLLFPDVDVTKMDTNDSSVIAKYYYGDNSALLTGDSPIKMEKYLVGKLGKGLQSDILKLGHHGSKTSSSVEFLSVVNPKYAVISAGLNNKYGHPHKEVLDLLDKMQIPYLNTALVGDIEFDLNGTTIKSIPEFSI